MARFAFFVLLVVATGCRLFKPNNSVGTVEKSGEAPSASDPMSVLEGDSLPRMGRPDNASCLAWPKAKAPQLLSQTGCFDPKDPRQPLAALIPYEVALEFWSDTATKKRWIALPHGEKVAFNAAGEAKFPPRSVLIKEFERQGKKIETRFFVREQAGGWSGYSYEWNEAESEATLVAEGGKVVEGAPGGLWTFPSREACLRCHNAASGPTLGWELAQLNRKTQRTDGLNQLEAWQQIGVIAPLMAQEAENWPQLKIDGSLDERARAYLHVNCAMCHRPGGGGLGALDLRLSRTFAEMKICEIEAEVDDLGLAEGRLLKPQHPEASVLVQRMARNDYSRMPPLASHLIDEEGVKLISEWIKGIDACPPPADAAP